ncbi:hypothetical protein LEP1GSC058_1102 [Leptospira fainei serovar Hurstbridge str. BUT 6]|uniref:Uncharacterized protein n=1 Tax=Leptospira fainei serovar Hurstbridge str. BUT 6 TaxID=1193011 RepID=S3VX16_9LEPT|nr:hypothetical protein LEP1GSC058_1102 [Leptospira fainei serovar Hurstbridge str. BUT 6]
MNPPGLQAEWNSKAIDFLTAIKCDQRTAIALTKISLFSL